MSAVSNASSSRASPPGADPGSSASGEVNTPAEVPADVERPDALCVDDTASGTGERLVWQAVYVTGTKAWRWLGREPVRDPDAVVIDPGDLQVVSVLANRQAALDTLQKRLKYARAQYGYGAPVVEFSAGSVERLKAMLADMGPTLLQQLRDQWKARQDAAKAKAKAKADAVKQQQQGGYSR